MKELPKYYALLLNAVEDAVAALERQDFGVAKSTLLRGQILAEEEYCAMMEREKREKREK